MRFVPHICFRTFLPSEADRVVPADAVLETASPFGRRATSPLPIIPPRLLSLDRSRWDRCSNSSSTDCWRQRRSRAAYEDGSPGEDALCALYIIHTPVKAAIQHAFPFLPTELLRWGTEKRCTCCLSAPVFRRLRFFTTGSKMTLRAVSTVLRRSAAKWGRFNATRL